MKTRMSCPHFQSLASQRRCQPNLLLAAAVLLACAVTCAAQTTFSRITTGAIATNTHGAFGCGWGDYDGDGYLDLIVSDYGPGIGCGLYHNNGNGAFTRVTTGVVATTDAEADGVVWGDYDNDGDLDLFVANWEVPSFLFRNDGSGNFTRIIHGSMGSNATRTLGCAWGDYDSDGLVDLIVANAHVQQNPILYHNDGDATFTQIVDGPVVTSGACPLWSDYDNDGALDLFMGRGFPGGQSILFHNDGGGSFSSVATAAILGTGQGGCDWGDYDNDGDLDLAVSGAPEPNGNDQLYRNDGGGTFTPIADGGIFNGGDTSVICAWGDYDNDGWLDLFMTHHSGRTSFLFHNNGDGTFTRVMEGSIVNDVGNWLGCAWGDYDNDGFLDLFVANGGVQARQAGALYHNDGNSNRWLSIKCVGAASNRSGIGAKVRVKAVIGGVTLWQLREISSGNGYNGSGFRAHFGLGEATNADLVRIEWPSGTVQELHNVTLNRILTVKEPPVLTALRKDESGAFRLTLKGGRGLAYTVEHSTNLIHWSGLMSFTATNTMMLFTDSSPISPSIRFYRAREND